MTTATHDDATTALPAATPAELHAARAKTFRTVAGIFALSTFLFPTVFVRLLGAILGDGVAFAASGVAPVVCLLAAAHFISVSKKEKELAKAAEAGAATRAYNG